MFFYRLVKLFEVKKVVFFNQILQLYKFCSVGREQHIVK